MLAVAYVRWSTSDQTRGDAERRQTDLAQKMCNANSWQLSEIIVERGKSAFKGRNRLSTSELGKLEARAAAGELQGKVLIVENVDRLSRQEPIEGLNLLQNLTNAGVIVAESATGHVFDADSVRENWQKLLVPFLRLGLGYEESLKKGKRVAAAYEATVARGYRTKNGLADLRFSPSWIERDEVGDYSVNEMRAEVVRLIYQRCVDGYGLRSICAELNRDLARTRWQKGDWNQANVREILRNRQTLGEYQVTERNEANFTRPTGKWIKGGFPAIIEPELWHRAQAALDARRSTGGKHRGMVNLLQGFTYCGAINHGERCGSRMIISQTSRTEPRKARLRCARNHRAAGCSSRASYHYERLLNGILDEVLHLALPAERQNSSIHQEIATLELEITAAIDNADLLRNDWLRTKSPTMRRGIDATERQIEEMESKLEKLKHEARLIDAKRPPRVAADVVRKLRDRIHHDEDARRKIHSALREMITAIFLYPDTREAHVLVAGIYALRFDGLGNLLDRQLATSAMMEGAHTDDPIALARFIEARGIEHT